MLKSKESSKFPHKKQEHQESLIQAEKRKLYSPFLWIGFNCINAIEPLRGDNLLSTIKSRGSSGTHLIDIGRVKAHLTMELPSSFEFETSSTHPVALNQRSVDSKSIALTTYWAIAPVTPNEIRMNNSNIGKAKF